MSLEKVAIVMGSESDRPVMQKCARHLEYFEIPHEIHVMSAHRTPDLVSDFARHAEERGYGVIIAAAGLAAHLPGVIAAHTLLPVIGVPIAGGSLQGVDALLSIVQMPAGVPVATVAIGSAGAQNAAILAAQILAAKHAGLKEKLRTFKQNGARLPS